MDHQRILEIFITEAEDLLADLEQGLVALEGTPDAEVINSVFRAAHTFKGNAGMAGLEAIVRVSHAMENLLSQVREGTLEVSEDVISALLSGTDALRDLVAGVGSDAPNKLTAAQEAMIARLDECCRAKEKPAATKSTEDDEDDETGPRVFEVAVHLPSDVFSSGQDPAWLLQELAELGEVIELNVDASALPRLAEMDPQQSYLGWRVVLRTEAGRTAVQEVFIFVDDGESVKITDVSAKYNNGVDVTAADKKLGELLIEDGLLSEKDIAEALKKQRKLGEILVNEGRLDRESLHKALGKQQAARKVRQSSSIRVDTDKLDRLVNLVGEMVISVAQVTQKARDEMASQSDRVTAAESLEHITRELQEEVMSLRMVPVKDTFDRFRRAVRDLARDLGKHVMLEMSGTETELDKNVIDQLVDPLKHMIRNAIAHGIEPPQERIEAGKSDTARVHLRAYQREGHIIIEVSDDGRGIDEDVVLQRARERGLVPPGKTLSQSEVYALLFEPGFSTAARVDEVSGRGVGLDVVRRNIESLRGSIDIESRYGKGTTFRIRLPLTLAIIDGMNVRVGAGTVTIPLLSVVELIEPKRGIINTVEGKGELVDVRGELLPMVRLRDVLDVAAGEADARDARVVVVEDDGRKFGMLVDRVLGMEQAVIKSLDTSFTLFGHLESGFERPDGLAGAAILGDGSVGLILDVRGIETMAFGAQA